MRISISNIAWDIHEDAAVSEILQSHNVDAIDIAPGKYLKKFPSFNKNKILQIRKWWASKGIEIIVYEPLLKEPEYFGSSVINDLDEFKRGSDLIITNRKSEEISDVSDRVFTRDLYETN